MKFITILHLIIYSSLVYSQETKINCIENQKFKQYYFENISIIEKYCTDSILNKTISLKTVENALDQINKYTRVNYTRIVFADWTIEEINYSQNEKQKWLDWYETNKCRNLKRNKIEFYTLSIYKPKPLAEQNDSCIENIDFYKYYFKYISIAEQYVQGPKLKRNLNLKKFLNALSKIDKYSEVSWNHVLNYAGMYSFEDFEKDLKTWLEWYELNKCRNIYINNKEFYRSGLKE